jgi:hypothetical protein
MLEHVVPLWTAETDGAGRNLLGYVHDQHSAETHALHGFEIGRDAFASDIPVEPKPIYPWTRKVRRANKARFQTGNSVGSRYDRAKQHAPGGKEPNIMASRHWSCELIFSFSYPFNWLPWQNRSKNYLVDHAGEILFTRSDTFRFENSSSFEM